MALAARVLVGPAEMVLTRMPNLAAVCVCVCARARARACVRLRVRAYVRA